MSTAAVAPNSIYHEIQAYFQQRKSDLSQLGDDLQSGNLKDAEQAYSSIVTLGQSGPFANGVPFVLTQREKDFTAIGQALQSGDSAGAQQAFTQLENTFNKQTGPGSGGGPEIVINFGQPTETTPAGTTSNSNTGGTGAEIVINIGNNSNSPENIALDLSNIGNGMEQLTIKATEGNQPPEQLTLKFSQNSHEKIVLNLLDSFANTSAGPQSNAVSLVA